MIELDMMILPSSPDLVQLTAEAICSWAIRRAGTRKRISRGTLGCPLLMGMHIGFGRRLFCAIVYHEFFALEACVMLSNN